MERRIFHSEIGLITVFDAILTSRQSSQKSVFVWESDSKYLFPELNFSQFVKRNVKILGRRLYSPSLKDVAVLEVAELIFFILYIFFCTSFLQTNVCKIKQI